MQRRRLAILLGPYVTSTYLGNSHVHWCSWYLWQQALAGPAQVGDACECCEAVDGVEGTTHRGVVDVGLQRQQDQLQDTVGQTVVRTSVAEESG